MNSNNAKNRNRKTRKTGKAIKTLKPISVSPTYANNSVNNLQRKNGVKSVPTVFARPITKEDIAFFESVPVVDVKTVLKGSNPFILDGMWNLGSRGIVYGNRGLKGFSYEKQKAPYLWFLFFVINLS